MNEIIYHFPPELFDLLVDTIPRLCRSKKSIPVFFQGAGVSKQSMSDLIQIVDHHSDNINKFDITRQLLIRMGK